MHDIRVILDLASARRSARFGGDKAKPSAFPILAGGFAVFDVDQRNDTAQSRIIRRATISSRTC